MNQKCNLCDRADGLTAHPFMPGGWLCPEHAAKSRQKQSSRKQVAAHLTQGAVIVDRDELLGLKAEGLIPIRTYVYLALRIDNVTEQLKPLDIRKFSKRWCLAIEDVISALASLSKKGIVVVDVQKLMAQTLTHQERKAAMEKAYADSTK